MHRLKKLCIPAPPPRKKEGGRRGDRGDPRESTKQCDQYAALCQSHRNAGVRLCELMSARTSRMGHRSLGLTQDRRQGAREKRGLLLPKDTSKCVCVLWTQITFLNKDFFLLLSEVVVPVFGLGKVRPACSLSTFFFFKIVS